MNCELWQGKLDAFVDMELPTAELRDFESHLRECPACSAEAVARQRLKTQTRLAGQMFVPSAEFEKKMQRSAEKPRSHWSWFPALAAATAALLFIASFVVWKQRSNGNELVSQIVDQHVAMMASTSPVDVVSTDAHTVKPWFNGRVPFSVDVPPLDGTQFTLVGGRMAYLQQAPAAHLVFAVRKHRISVFMFREEGRTEYLGDQPVPSKRMGFETETWVEDGVRYFAISDVNPQDVHDLCDLLKRSDKG